MNKVDLHWTAKGSETNPAHRIHDSILATDAKLSLLRDMYCSLYENDSEKDILTGLALALMDQGRMSSKQINDLMAEDIYIHGSELYIGASVISSDPDVLETLAHLTRNPNKAFIVNVNSKPRPIGSNYLNAILSNLGIPPNGLRAYHATLTYTRAYLKEFSHGKTDHESADYARDIVALDLAEENSNKTLSEYVDPVIQKFLSLKQGDRFSHIDPNDTKYISLNISGKSKDEKEFSIFISDAMHGNNIEKGYILPPHLKSLSSSALEAMCINCGICCVGSVKIGDEKIRTPDLGCKYLEWKDDESRCSIYETRHEVAKDWCQPLAAAISKGILPDLCPYVKDLDSYSGPISLSEDQYNKTKPLLRALLASKGQPQWTDDTQWQEFMGKK